MYMNWIQISTFIIVILNLGMSFFFSRKIEKSKKEIRSDLKNLEKGLKDFQHKFTRDKRFWVE